MEDELEKSVMRMFDESLSRTSLTDQYELDGSETEIKITLITGDTGQAALSELEVDGSVRLSSHKDSLRSYSIGTNKNLKNRFVRVTTIITDISHDHDMTGISFSVQGGVAIYESMMGKKVASEGASIAYSIKILFF